MRDKQITVVTKQLQDMVSFFGVNAPVSVNDTGEAVELTIETTEGARLIGHHGETLRSIQYLLNLMASHEGERVFYSVDVAGYKKARAEALAEKANKAADTVVETGTEWSMPPMSPGDRRLMHMALAERTDVETESRGEGRGRRLVIKKRA